MTTRQQSEDFRVQQTYGEIRQLIEDEAMSVLGDDLNDSRPWYDEWTRSTAKRIAESVVNFLDAATESREEWRFFWPRAQDDMNGARLRPERPSEEEIAQWREEWGTFWLERRVVHEGDWERVALDDTRCPRCGGEATMFTAGEWTCDDCDDRNA